MKKTKNDTLLVKDLKYALSDKFPADHQIQDLKIKIEAAQQNISECQETIEYWEKLRRNKLMLSN